MAPADEYSDEEEEEEDDEEDEEQDDEEDDEDDEDEDDEEEEEEEVEPAPKPVRKRKNKSGKDPNKPKRNMSAFFIYSGANRSRVKEENPGIAFGQIAKILSKEYKALPDSEKKHWEKKAAADKKRYQAEMKHYVPPPDEGGKRRGKKAKKDPNKPKRNLSAYFLFSVAIRPVIKQEHPDAAFGEIAKMISQRFKQLPEHERASWDAKAAEDKVRYDREMKVYKGN